MDMSFANQALCSSIWLNYKNLQNDVYFPIDLDNRVAQINEINEVEIDKSLKSKTLT